MARRKKRTAKRRSYRRNPGVDSLMLLNPPRRRRSSKRRSVSRKRTRRSAVARFTGRVRRYSRRVRRSGGGSLSLSGIFPMVKEGAFLALGAVVTTQIYTRFVPESVKAQRELKHLSRVGVAVVTGMLMSRFVSPALGRAFTLGGVANALLVAGNDYLGASAVPLGAIEEDALGMYYAGMGDYYSAGPTVSGRPTLSAFNSQPDSLAWDAGVPERLDPQSRF